MDNIFGIKKNGNSEKQKSDGGIKFLYTNRAYKILVFLLNFYIYKGKIKL